MTVFLKILRSSVFRFTLSNCTYAYFAPFKNGLILNFFYNISAYLLQFSYYLISKLQYSTRIVKTQFNSKQIIQIHMTETPSGQKIVVLSALYIKKFKKNIMKY